MGFRENHKHGNNKEVLLVINDPDDHHKTQIKLHGGLWSASDKQTANEKNSNRIYMKP